MDYKSLDFSFFQPFYMITFTCASPPFFLTLYIFVGQRVACLFLWCFMFHTFFMIFILSRFFNKIETHFFLFSFLTIRILYTFRS